MDMQFRTTRVLTVPEYYAEYRETGNSYAAFLGTSITAKVSLVKNTTITELTILEDYLQ
jgi:hypothetical protein